MRTGFVRSAVGVVPVDGDDADITDLRDILYGLHAILRLHTVQEDEAYLSLGDTASSTLPCRRNGEGR
jgi:hypothetical protein